MNSFKNKVEWRDNEIYFEYDTKQLADPVTKNHLFPFEELARLFSTQNSIDLIESYKKGFPRKKAWRNIKETNIRLVYCSTPHRGRGTYKSF